MHQRRRRNSTDSSSTTSSSTGSWRVIRSARARLLRSGRSGLCDLLEGVWAPTRSRHATWVLFAAFLVGCVGAKSYSLVVMVGALLLFLLWRLVADRVVHRPALIALALSAAVYVAANLVVLGWNRAGATVRPFKNLELTKGVVDLDEYFGYLWGTSDVPTGIGVAFGVFGLLGVPIVGHSVASQAETARTVAGREALLVLLHRRAANAVPLEPAGIRSDVRGVLRGRSGHDPRPHAAYLLWFQHARPSAPALSVFVVAARCRHRWLGSTSCWMPLRESVCSSRSSSWLSQWLQARLEAWSRSRLVIPIALSVGILGGLRVDTTLVRLLPGVDEEARYSIGTAVLGNRVGSRNRRARGRDALRGTTSVV